MPAVSKLEAEKNIRQEWQIRIEQMNALEELTDLLVDFRKNSRPPKYTGGDYRWIEAKMEERLAKLKGEQWEPAEMTTKTTRGESLAGIKEQYLGQVQGITDFRELEQQVDDFRERYRPPIMPVDEFLTIERELCEVLTKVRGERWWEMSEQELRDHRGAVVKKEKNEQPHTLMVLYPPPANKEAFETAYLGEHIPLARKLPAKAIRTEVVGSTLTGDVAPYHRIAELHFEDRRGLQTCVQTPAAQAALEHAVQISNGGKPHFLVLESEMAIDEEPGKPRPPVKCMVCFSQPEDKKAFDATYFTEILPQMLKLPAKQFKAYTVVATADDAESPLHRILEFFFDSQAELESCMASTNGKLLLDALTRVATPFFVVIAA